MAQKLIKSSKAVDRLEAWKKERDEVVKTLDVDAFKVFYMRWYFRGVYYEELPKDDRVIEISLRKMLYHLESATKEEKQNARLWLVERGFDTSF